MTHEVPPSLPPADAGAPPRGASAGAEEADVIVVGAGPAGSATATYLARAGLNVLLLEKATFPREKVCGDGLTPRAVKALTRKLGVREGAVADAIWAVVQSRFSCLSFPQQRENSVAS